MHSARIIEYAIPLLACALLSVDAQPNSSSIFDSLRTSWSSVLDSSKGAFDELHSSLSSALDSSKTALNNFRSSVSDVVRPSKVPSDDSISRARTNTSGTSTAGPTVKNTPSTTRQFSATPVATQTVAHSASEPPRSTPNSSVSPTQGSVPSRTVLKTLGLAEILTTKSSPTAVTTEKLSSSPAASPTQRPTVLSSSPTTSPTNRPTSTTKRIPASRTASPTGTPTGLSSTPTTSPTYRPTASPTAAPIITPACQLTSRSVLLLSLLLSVLALGVLAYVALRVYNGRSSDYVKHDDVSSEPDSVRPGQPLNQDILPDARPSCSSNVELGLLNDQSTVLVDIHTLDALQGQYNTEKDRADQATAEALTAKYRVEQAEALCQMLQIEYDAAKAQADHAAAEAQEADARADQAEAHCERLQIEYDADVRHFSVMARETRARADQAEALCELITVERMQLEHRLEPSVRLKSGQECSFREIIGPCLRPRLLITHSVSSVALEDGYLVTEQQLRNLEAVLEFLLADVPTLQYVFVKTKRPEACRQQLNEAQRTNAETHTNTLKEMFERVRGSKTVVFKLKYNDAMHDRKMLFDNGWELHMGKGLDFIRLLRGPTKDVSATKKYRSRDVGDASIDFTYTWAKEEVAEYFREQAAIEEFDAVVDTA